MSSFRENIVCSRFWLTKETDIQTIVGSVTGIRYKTLLHWFDIFTLTQIRIRKKHQSTQAKHWGLSQLCWENAS
jgi:hypothetical protein